MTEKLVGVMNSLIDLEPADKVEVDTVDKLKLALANSASDFIKVLPNQYTGNFVLNHPAKIFFEPNAIIKGRLTLEASNVLLYKPAIRPADTGTSLTLLECNRGHEIQVIEGADIDGLNNGRVKRGVEANAENMLIQNSSIRGIWSSGQDSQAICGWETRGPIQIRNNFLEAASENIMFGGAGSTPAGVVVSLLVIEGNTITKRLEWKPLAGTGINVKNLLEFKLAHDVVVRNNKLSNSWTDGQTGFAILVNTRPSNAPTVANMRVLIQNNEIDNVNMVVGFLGRDYNHVSGRGMDYTFVDNYCTNIREGLIQTSAEPLFTHIDHNTFLTIPTAARISKLLRGKALKPDGTLEVCGPTYGFRFTNNIVMNGRYGLWSEEGGANAKGIGKPLLPDGVVAGNIIGGYPFVESHNYSPVTNALISKADWDAGVAANDPSWYIEKSTDGTRIGRRT